MNFTRTTLSSYVKPNYMSTISKVFFSSNSQGTRSYDANEKIDYEEDISAEMGGNARDSMLGRKHIIGKSEEMNEKAYKMGGNPKGCMGEGKAIRKDNASQMIQKPTYQEEEMKNDFKENVCDIKEDAKNETLVDKATNMAKGAKDRVAGTMEEGKKMVQGYVDAVKPSEENRDKEVVDQIDVDVERRPLNEKKHP